MLLWEQKTNRKKPLTSDLFLKVSGFLFSAKTIPNDTVQKRYQTIPIKTIPNDTERYGTVSFFGEFKTICFFASFKNDTDFLEKQRGEKWKTIPISTRNDTVISEKRYRFSTQTTPWKMKNDTPVSFGVVFSKVTIWDPGANLFWEIGYGFWAAQSIEGN